MRTLLLVVSILASGHPVATGQGRGAFAGQPRINALLVGGGPYHDYSAQNKIFVDAIGKSLPVNWTIVQPDSGVADGKTPLYNNPDWHKGFDIVVHNECFANQADPGFLKQITAAHKAGIPSVVIHCAMHSYRAAKVDDWREFLGVTTRRHTEQHRITVKWNAAHPIAAGMPEWTTPMDELYVIEKIWPGTFVIGTAVSPDEGNPEFALAWTHEYQGKARVFGTTLGHGMATWEDPAFQELLTRGFRWALKKDVVTPPAAQGEGR
jgi:type 1 glutamine amidotransferase